MREAGAGFKTEPIANLSCRILAIAKTYRIRGATLRIVAFETESQLRDKLEASLG